jgi:hypothetical protein
MTRNLAIFLAAVDIIEGLTPATHGDGYVAEVDDHPLAIEPRQIPPIDQRTLPRR